MPSALPAILALLTGSAGLYYLFYSRAAERLAHIEADHANTRRVRLRRANGAAMICLAVLLYAGARVVDADLNPRTFVAVWLGAFAVLLVIVVLGLADVRLTFTLRKGLRKDQT
ncbi:MAG: hypothetical protein JWL69_1480 [Phycisphaerales bacterium]|nr:hypothetical protein [Phycisphaerales bacterium]MDB5356328.1 hypothetical protein [Phycisphaerales bacterium]